WAAVRPVVHGSPQARGRSARAVDATAPPGPRARPPPPAPRSSLRREPLQGSLACRSSRRALDERPDDREALIRPEDRFGRALGMWHQPRDVPRSVEDAGDRPEAAVRVVLAIVLSCLSTFFVDVAEQHLALSLQRVERRVVRVVAALAVCEWAAERRAPGRQAVGERRVEPLGGDPDVATQATQN